MPYLLNPIYLASLGLIAVPLLIHLIRRRRLKVITWAAMEFLKQSQKRQRRRLRIEELILLALRMLIVALAVLAFARPVMRGLGLPLLGQNARVYAVIVLDNSYSMGQRGPDGRSSWERARQAAQQIATQVLKPGDAASLVLMSDKPNAAIGAPSFDLRRVGSRVDAAPLTDRSTDYFTAARLVADLLKASKIPYKEVYWLTDDQASAWASSKKGSAHTVWEAIGQQARVTWVSVGAPVDRRDNLAVHLLPPGRELVTPSLPARLEARVSNYGATRRDNLLVNLSLDGQPGGSKRISLGSHAAATVAFTPGFPHAGAHTGTIFLADPEHIDTLARDNRAPFVIRSRERIRALVLDMQPNADSRLSEAFYLNRALRPGDVSENFEVQSLEGTGLGAAMLHNYETVILTGLKPLTTADQRALSEYVRQGGGLLLFPGPDTDARRVTETLSAAGLLPARLGLRRSPGADQPATLDTSSISAATPALALFKDTANINLGSAHFNRYLALEPVLEGVEPGEVQVMLRFGSKDPAFVQRKVGLGYVILAASSAGSSWNDLPRRGSLYVPLLYQLVANLGEGANAHRNLHQDEPLLLSLPLADAGKPVRVTRPDGRAVTQNSVLDARGVTFRFADTAQAGLYRVAVVGSRTADAFSVALPADESDVTPPTDIRLAVTQAGVAANKLEIAHTPAELAASIHRARYGSEVWRSLISAVIALLFLESLLAQRFGRRG